MNFGFAAFRFLMRRHAIASRQASGKASKSSRLVDRLTGIKEKQPSVPPYVIHHCAIAGVKGRRPDAMIALPPIQQRYRKSLPRNKEGSR